MNKKKCYMYFFFTLMPFIAFTNNRKEVVNNLPTQYDLQTAKLLSLSRVIVIPTLIGLMWYFNKQSIHNNLQSYPVSSFATVFFAYNYIIDSAVRHNQIKNAINNFTNAQLLSRYILCSIAIKNTLIENNNSFYVNEFNLLISNNLHFSFKELELLAFEMLNSSINTINKLNIEINTDATEKVYFLFKDNLNVDQALELTSNNNALRSELQLFKQNPINHYKSLALYLNKEIIKQTNQLLHQPT